MPEIVQYSQHDTEISLLQDIFLWSEWALFGACGGFSVGGILCADGNESQLTDNTFHARSYHGPTSQLYGASLP